MHPRITALLALGLLCLTPSLLASGKKEPTASITFHMETAGNDNPKMIFPQQVNGKTRYFRRMPDIMTTDIQSFSPFPSEVGQDYGVTFKLKDHAAKRLSAVTNMNQGRWMLAQANGRVVDAVIIDQPISDGMLVIWKSLTLNDIATLDESMPRIGQEGKKKKK